MPSQLISKPERRTTASRDALLEQLRDEFRHTPGLALTPLQAARLFNVEPETCERLIAALADEGAIRVRPDGRIVWTHHP
jgi:hypothetical protein